MMHIFIGDENGNEQIIFQTTSSAVNQIDVTNAATGNPPEISATGDDTNIDLKLTPKGSGKLNLDGIKFPNADGTQIKYFYRWFRSFIFCRTASGGTSWQSTVVTASTLNAVSGEGYFLDTTSNAITVTLPGSPSVGDIIECYCNYFKKFCNYLMDLLLI